MYQQGKISNIKPCYIIVFSNSDYFKPLLKRLLQTQSFKEWCLLEALLLRPCLGIFSLSCPSTLHQDKLGPCNFNYRFIFVILRLRIENVCQSCSQLAAWHRPGILSLKLEEELWKRYLHFHWCLLSFVFYLPPCVTCIQKFL